MKNRAKLLFLLQSLFLLLFVDFLGALDLVESLHDRGHQMTLTLQIRDFPGDIVLKALSEGYRSEVIFSLRTVRKRMQGLPFFNEEILGDQVLSITAFKDPFLGELTMTLPQGGMASFNDEKLFIQFLAQLTSYPLNPIPVYDPEEFYYYLQVRAEVIPIRLVPPLNLLTLFSDSYRLTTPWRVIPLIRLNP